MRIPKEVKLAGMTIRVEFDTELYRKNKVVAEARYPEQLIVIDSSMLTVEGVVQSYYHELMHHILFILNEEELRKNEKFVDTVAHLIHQAAQATTFYTLEDKPHETEAPAIHTNSSCKVRRQKDSLEYEPISQSSSHDEQQS